MDRKVNFLEGFWWVNSNPPINYEQLKLINNLPFKLPKTYINLLKVCNGGIVDYDFCYFDNYSHCYIQSGIGIIYGVDTGNEYDILKLHRDPPEYFPNYLIAFAEVGNGDLVCFNFANIQIQNEINISYWNHSADNNQEISKIADSFENFILMITNNSKSSR